MPISIFSILASKISQKASNFKDLLAPTSIQSAAKTPQKVTDRNDLSLALLAVETQTSASLETIDPLVKAQRVLNANRAKIGALSNHLERALNNISASIENLTAAESAISNMDMALEAANLTKNQLLTQPIVGYSNLLNRGVLQLLR